MKISIENLKAQMQGKKLNLHQRADALIEFNKLLEYVEKLEQRNTENICDYCEEEISDNDLTYDEYGFPAHKECLEKFIQHWEDRDYYMDLIGY